MKKLTKVMAIIIATLMLSVLLVACEEQDISQLEYTQALDPTQKTQLLNSLVDATTEQSQSGVGMDISLSAKDNSNSINMSLALDYDVTEEGATKGQLVANLSMATEQFSLQHAKAELHYNLFGDNEYMYISYDIAKDQNNNIADIGKLSQELISQLKTDAGVAVAPPTVEDLLAQMFPNQDKDQLIADLVNDLDIYVNGDNYMLKPKDSTTDSELDYQLYLQFDGNSVAQLVFKMKATNPDSTVVDIEARMTLRRARLAEEPQGDITILGNQESMTAFFAPVLAMLAGGIL